MPIPKTRQELSKQVTRAFEKLRAELEQDGPKLADLPCVDDWTVRDLLAVRAWWTESVVDWIEKGRQGEIPVTPVAGYSWQETPRLNADLVHKSRRETYREIRARLERGFERVLILMDSLSDRELLEVGTFQWAGSYPISRWISLNTARQYTTARTYIRRVRRLEQSHGA